MMWAAILALVPVLQEGRGEEYVVRTWKKIVLSDQFVSEGAHAGDFNRDGRMDVASGPWWYEGPDFTRRHEYFPVRTYKKDNDYSNCFFVFTYDFNKDGWTDILVYGFPGKDASWFENPQGRPGHWPRHVLWESVDMESPGFEDVDGDGVPEIVCASGGQLGYVTIRDGKFHAISPKGHYQRFTHGLGLGDVNGDGRKDFLETGGWWEQPSHLEGDPMWTRRPASFGEAGAQIYAYDVDGDGDSDILGAVHAHQYGVAWWEQVREGGEIRFRRHLIVGSKPEENRYGVKFSQPHAIDLVDVDGDGLKDLVTGKRHFAHGSKGDAEPLAPPVLYWFRLVRGPQGPDFVPYLIDDASGVGTQVVATDVNGDGRPDVVVGNKMGTFVHLQEARRVSREEWEKAQPKPLR
jgi:hypothetical protein